MAACYGSDCLLYKSGGAIAQGANSSFMSKYGNVFGWMLLSMWLILTIYAIIYVYKSIKIDKKEKKTYYIGTILFSIFIFADMIYYLIATHYKSTNRNLIFVNIALIPIYLIIGLVLLLISNR